jgi:hypothetical protein
MEIGGPSSISTQDRESNDTSPSIAMDIDDVHFSNMELDSASDTTTSLVPSMAQPIVNTRKPLNKLPAEILDKIFRHELHRSQGVPNLLYALSADKDPSTGKRTHLYDVAKYSYWACNLRIMQDNFEAFKRRKLNGDLSNYDHIEIVLPVSMRSTTVTWKNHFETITFDLSNIEGLGDHRTAVGSQAGWLISASSSVRLLVVKDKIGRDIAAPESESGRDLDSISKRLGLQPKRDHDSRMQYWIWGREDGDKLSCEGWR